MSALDEVNASLLTVNSAIERLVAGKSVTSLSVKSAGVTRLYTYAEINLESLKALQNELLNQQRALTQDVPTFKAFATIPMICSKGDR